PINGAIKPKTTDIFDLGDSSKRYRYGYFQKLFFDSLLLNDGEITKVTSSTPFIFNAGLSPKVDQAQNLGATTAYWNNVFSKTVHVLNGLQINGLTPDASVNRNSIYVDSNGFLKFKDGAGTV